MIHKPVGVSVHKDQLDVGLVMQLEQQLDEKLYLVHRLDKVTSGLMVLARHSFAAGVLSEQFRLHQIRKYYLAISDSKPKRKQGLILGDMQKSRRGAWKLIKSKNNPAITQFFSASVRPKLRVFLLRPTTGKTHQIRVALKSEGAPILGDELYAGNKSDRTYLHAYYIAFNYGGKHFSFKQLPTEGSQFDETCLHVINEYFSEPDNLDWPEVKRVINHE